MARSVLSPGDLVWSSRRARPAFGLIVAVEKPANPEVEDTYYTVIIDERLVRTHEASVWTWVQALRP